MTARYILATTLQEAHAFARDELGLSRGHYRVVTSPSSISGPRNADLHLVPGWEKRHDRFAMKGAIKYTRLNKVEAPEQDEAPVLTPRQIEAAYRYNRLLDQPVPAVPDGLEPAGEQLTIEDANAFLMAVGHPNPEIKELVEEPTKTEQAEAPVARRRSRCKTCGTLHFKDESCPSEPLPGV